MSIEKERQDHVYFAKLAEQAERFDEMVDHMKAVARLNVDLTVEERNLLSVGYKNMIGAKRASWRTMSSFEQKELEMRPNGKHAELIKSYRLKIERELSDACNEMLSIIEENLLPCSSEAEAKVFFYKMKGDYHRYLAEFKADEEKTKATEDSKASYEEASVLARDYLVATHPIRLGLALNYSVFHYEILNSPEKACQLARKAFDDAIADLDHLSEETYKDSTLIIQLLRDNLTLWTSDLPDDGGEDGNKNSDPRDLPGDD